MLFLVRNIELIKDKEKTYLTAPVKAGDTSLIVRAVDNNSWANDDWIILGEIGSKNAEILQINGSVSDGTILTIDNAGSGGARYDHSVDEPVYRIDYNQIEFSRANTPTGSKTVLATVEIQPDDEYTRYEDTANGSGYGFVRFKNSATSSYSSYSDAIPYTGYTKRSLGKIIAAVRRILGEPDFKFLTDEEIIEEINEKQRDVAHERLWSFLEDVFSDSSVAYKKEYKINESVVLGKVHAITFKSRPLAKIDAHRFDILNWDTSQIGTPTHFSIWNNKIRLYPLPSSSAATTTLNGDISASDTTITVNSTSSFAASGRIKIGDEIISYTSKTATQFLGCERGLEGTTATSHLSGSEVVERDIVYTAHKEPDELTDIQDETPIPDPSVLVYGAAMELALGKIQDQVLHDRLKIKYERAIERLREKFGRKGTFAYFKIKDKEDIVSDAGSFRNPNDYPQNIG
jgi:hypothetical protein